MTRQTHCVLVGALIAVIVAIPLHAAPAPIQPAVIDITGYRSRFDQPGVSAIQRYLLLDVNKVDVMPIDAAGNEGDGVIDIHARAVLVLFVGGGGQLRLQPGQLNTATTNFIARTRYHFASAGYVVALADAASDFLSLPEGLTGHRLAGRPYSKHYLLDLQALIKDLRKRFPKMRLWMVGTSRGTLSAARAAAELGPPPKGPDGIVLTSSLTGPSSNGDMTGIARNQITVPTLIVTNKTDKCHVTKPRDSVTLQGQLTASPRVDLLVFSSAHTPLDTKCGPLTAHGFFGIEQAVIDGITNWIDLVVQ